MASVPVLARLMSRRLRALAQHLPAALESDVKGIHQARVASRRLRELIPIVASALPPRRRRRLQRRLRKLTRALGLVRELDVALASIDELAEAHEEPGVALALLRKPLARQRESSAEHLVHQFDKARAHRLLTRLGRVEALLTEVASPPGWRIVLAERIRARAHGLQAAVADAGALFDGERLHAVRIAAKKLRYVFEVAGEARTATTGTLVRQLKEVQDILGRLHDVEVLLGYLRGLTEDVPADAGAAASAASIHGLDRELTAETRRLHARYLRRQATLVAIGDRALDVVAPRVEAGDLGDVRPPDRSGLIDHA